MSQLTPDKVFKGFWINHAEGQVLGSTITMSSRTANIVVAILSVLIAFTGKHLWNVIAFVAYGALASSSEKDNLHYQQQTMLRNIDSPATMFLRGVKTRWSWRKETSGRTCFTPLDLLALLAAICSIGFIAAGVLSSQVVTSDGIEVLAYAPSCGFTAWDPSDSKAAKYFLTTIQESLTYTHNCYNASSSDTNCQIYTTQAIPFHTEYDACPFGDMCKLETNSALSMDTGLLWSNDIFGINTQQRDAMALRQVIKCAPLNVTKYQTIAPMDSIVSQRDFQREPLTDEDMVTLILGKPTDSPYNDTFEISSVVLNTTASYDVAAMSWWNASSEFFSTSPWLFGSGDYEPIDALERTEGDLALIAMSRGRLSYTSPVDDPFYAAHVPVIATDYNAEPPENWTVYAADDIISVIGCSQQYQLCASEDKCTNLSYAMTAFSQILEMGLNSIQNVTLYSFANAIINYNTGIKNINRAPSSILLAADGSQSGNTPDLPANQWELEVKYWTAIVLTMLQRYMTDFAAGNSASFDYTLAHYKLPAGPSERVLCHAQKMKAPAGISNISVLGLSLTISVCGVIILLNLALLRTLRWLSKKRVSQWDFVEQWDQKENLSLQLTTSEVSSIGIQKHSINGLPVFVHSG